MAPVLTDSVPWALVRYSRYDDSFGSFGSFELDSTLRGVVYVLFNSSVLCLVVALNASAWAHYTSARLSLAARGRLPRRLQAFLADAHRLGILRQVGSVYQFRHARLQNHLAAGHAHLPSPRTISTLSNSSSRS
ncbi:hypothetical protein [Saccharothrix deserti]|uniref:hypothetical protein n=1 Tax=Saccharothrix deserti TaxID=2593674 RepID=UPI00131DC15E|nr:hypothetical protein [Saccharothrix deserti]